MTLQSRHCKCTDSEEEGLESLGLARRRPLCGEGGPLVGEQVVLHGLEQQLLARLRGPHQRLALDVRHEEVALEQRQADVLEELPACK